MEESEAARRLDTAIDELLADRSVAAAVEDDSLEAAALVLGSSLPRLHPRFGFEERLAQRLRGEAARSARPPGSADGQTVVAFPGSAQWAGGTAAPERSWRPGRLSLIGALASAASLALTLAGAGFVVVAPSPQRRAFGRARLMPIRLPFRPRPESSRTDLWTRCPGCGEMVYNKQLEKSLRVCPRCDHHFRLRVDARLAMLLDADSFDERDAGLESLDPLGFVDLKPYPDKLKEQQATTGVRDAAVWGFGRIDRTRVSICAMDFAFMGGSMGSVVGEKVTRGAEAALAERVPYITVSASGGARMQEGTLALMQLTKTCAAVERLADAGVPFISVMSDPTTGGVFASFAALGDVNIAEPNALIGFAGARVAAGTTGGHPARGLPARGVPLPARLRRPRRRTRGAARDAQRAAAATCARGPLTLAAAGSHAGRSERAQPRRRRRISDADAVRG